LHVAAVGRQPGLTGGPSVSFRSTEIAPSLGASMRNPSPVGGAESSLQPTSTTASNATRRAHELTTLFSMKILRREVLKSYDLTA
jgi:hypothetical protein